MSASKNNFDFIRLSAALMVLVSHQFALLRQPEPSLGVWLELGGIALYVFFSISGYLVAQSWQQDPNAWRFAAKRILRIWPALCVVALLSVLVLGPFVTALSLGEYFRSLETLTYFSTIRSMHVTSELPGVFENLPFPRAVNGSLWTIPRELLWYLILLVAGVIGALRFPRLVLAATLVFAVYHFGVFDAEHNAHRNWTNNLGVFFCSGACLYLLQDAWRPRAALVGFTLAALAATAWLLGHPFLAAWLFIPFATVSLGTASTPVLRDFGRFGDLSYGVYLFAFPVQQTLIWATGARWTPVEYLPLTVVCTLALAFASWHCIEKPALRLKPRTPQSLPVRHDRVLANFGGQRVIAMPRIDPVEQPAE